MAGNSGGREHTAQVPMTATAGASTSGSITAPCNVHPSRRTAASNQGLHRPSQSSSIIRNDLAGVRHIGVAALGSTGGFWQLVVWQPVVLATGGSGNRVGRSGGS